MRELLTCIGRVDILQMSVLPKLMYTFSLVPIKPYRLLVELA